MRSLPSAVIAAAVVVGGAGVAAAYPQYQLSREQTCASCHLSPVGGGTLDDNGLLTAEDESQWSGNSAFLHGLIDLPGWLRLGGDLRFAAGASDAGGGLGPAGFPMQADVYADARAGKVALHVTGGVTMPNEDKPYRALFSREHYLMWSQGEDDGVYLRAGRFMPVYGLRQAEHVFYTRRYGGTPLYGETYGVNVGWLSPRFEAHLTGFVPDPLVDSVQPGSGAALYVERRLAGRAAIGAEARYAISDLDTRLQGGLTGKLWLDGPGLLLQAEAQLIRQDFELARGPTRVQVVAELAATWFVHKAWQLDVAVGHYDQDVAIADVDRDALDLHLHWMMTSHIELLLTNRVALIGLGQGGAGSGYSLVQFHYRL